MINETIEIEGSEEKMIKRLEIGIEKNAETNKN